MVDRLEQRGFEPVANVEHAVAAIGKSAWPVGADVGEWRHEVGGAVAADAPIDWNEVEIANRRHDARSGLLRGLDKQRPVGWVSDVPEQVRSAERRAGKDWVRTCRARGSPEQ